MVLRLAWLTASIVAAVVTILGLSISPCWSQRTRKEHALSRGPPRGHPSQQQRGLQTTTTAIPYNSTNGVRELRKRLLQDYDKFSYPIEHHWAKGKRTGLPVQLTINFHRVFAVEVTQSMADLIVWVRQVWNDPRLVWDPAEYNNITTMQMWVSDGVGMGDTSEIWTPDLHLWNAVEPLATSLADAHALVTSDGTVFWARPGHLRPACQFEGLNKFPFDTLMCTVEIGSWGHSGLYLRPIKWEDGYTIGGSKTAGESYAEFTLDAISCEEYVYPPFIEAPDEDWPVMLYYVKFTRAWQPYARGYLALQILLNLIGFSTFWLPPRAGERMGLSITALLASVASELVVVEKLPAFGEISWVTQFSLASLLFTAVALLENIIVIYLHYHTGSSLTPRYITWAKRKFQERQQRKKGNHEQKPTNVANSHSTSKTKLQDGTSLRLSEHDADSGSAVDDYDPRKPRMQNRDPLSWAVDDDSLREQQSARDHPISRDDRADFVGRLTKVLSRKEVQHIETILGRDADDFKNDLEKINNARWQSYATIFDDVARIVFPVCYAIFLAVKFSQADM